MIYLFDNGFYSKTGPIQIRAPFEDAFYLSRPTGSMRGRKYFPSKFLQDEIYVNLSERLLVSESAWKYKSINEIATNLLLG